MAISDAANRRMEGWLYLIGSNRLGLQCSQKRYFVLEDNVLNCYKRGVPASQKEGPIRSAPIDSCMRVTDNGRESIHRNVFFIFTLYDDTNHENQLKLGARSSEEAATWIHLIKASIKECPNKVDKSMACSTRNCRSVRLGAKTRNRTNSIDWTDFSSIHIGPVQSDVIAPSSWTIIGCNNGLRLFEEVKDGDLVAKSDDPPTIMAIGVVDASSEAIFQTLISLGPSRSEWDFSLSHGSVIEHQDGHTDIIHKTLRGDWMPWGMKPRDLLLRRYWRREDDGTYVILYHSVLHENCRPERGYIRACLKSGGYVISPVNQGKQSVVKHMLSIDWKLWKSYLFSSSAKYVTVRMLGRVAALREFFRAKLGGRTCSDFFGEVTTEIGLPQSDKEDIKVEVQLASNNSKKDSVEHLHNYSGPSSGIADSFYQLNDTADEFFDIPDQPQFDQSEDMWQYGDGFHCQEEAYPKLSTAAVIVTKLPNISVQKNGYIDSQDDYMKDVPPCFYGDTLPKDTNCSMPCSWATTDPSTFLIRGESYVQDNHKIKADRTMMQMVGADWLKSDKREDDLGGRRGSIVQKYAVKGCNKFFFIVNIQVPGTINYSLALYYAMDAPLESVPLLESFVKGDDAYRNSRFKLIPYISEGSWIVKQSVGKKACLVGQALKINYFGGENYLELDIDVGSSTVAKGVVGLVLSYLNNLVIEMAFLVQGNTQEELPEVLLGTCRLNHLNVTKAIPSNPQ